MQLYLVCNRRLLCVYRWGWGIIAGVGAVAAAPFVLPAVGFGAAGIAAGSYAARAMSGAAIANGGGVTTASAVALCQSAGATGVLSTTANAIIGGTAVIAGKLASD